MQDILILRKISKIIHIITTLKNPKVIKTIAKLIV